MSEPTVESTRFERQTLARDRVLYTMTLPIVDGDKDRHHDFKLRGSDAATKVAEFFCTFTAGLAERAGDTELAAAVRKFRDEIIARQSGN